MTGASLAVAMIGHALMQVRGLVTKHAVADQLDAPWKTLVSCVARVSRLTYIKDTRSGWWATRGEIGYYPCQGRHDAEVLGCAIRVHGASRTALTLSGT